MARPKSLNPPLKEKLAEAALAVVNRDGAEKLTARSAATEAGVSANAPYLYYPDGAKELLATVAIGGFERLRSALNASPVMEIAEDRVSELTIRYTRFGVENDRLYRAMFHAILAKPVESRKEAGKGEATYARLHELKGRAYADLVAPLELLRLHASQDPWGAPGLALAALAHGLVGEFIDEGLLPPNEGAAAWSAERRQMTIDVTEILLRGIVWEPARTDEVRRSTAMVSMRPQDDRQWKLYGDTILEFFPGENPLAVDMRVPLSASTLNAMRDRGLPDSFVVLTAFNPRGRTMDDETNASRTRLLKERLRQRNLMWLPVDGVSPDGRHREAGVAVVLAEDDARRLAREFEQSALFAYDESAFRLVGALVDAPSTELPQVSE